MRDMQTIKKPQGRPNAQPSGSASGIMLNRKLSLRLFFLTLFAVVCFAQCYSILKSYLLYPRIINIYDESPSLISILPGLTICNNNRISLRKLLSRNATLRRAFNEKFSNFLQKDGRIKSLVDGSKFNDFRDELARLFERLRHYPDETTSNITVDGWFEQWPDSSSFIEWFGCARTWQDSIDCGNMTRIDSMHARRCTTLLHRGAMHYDRHHRPELFNATSGKTDTLNYFDAKEVIKMVLNFEPEDYADLKRQIGARLSFHDNNVVASEGDLDYFVTRGFKYDFTIDRKDVKFTNGPDDPCIEYEKLHLDRYKRRVDPRVPLTAGSCLQNCVIRNILQTSDCWVPQMPYYRNDSFDPELRHKHCSWFTRSNASSVLYELIRIDEVRARKAAQKGSASAGFGSRIVNSSSSSSPSSSSSSTPIKPAAGGNSSLGSDTEFTAPKRLVRDKMRKYRKTLRFCWSQCSLACRIATYTVTVTKSAWPTDVKILFDPTGWERWRRHCCALIAIKFTHFHYNIHEYRPKYDVANTVGDLGGLLAFWLGLSIVSIYHAVHKLVEFFGGDGGGVCGRRGGIRGAP